MNTVTVHASTDYPVLIGRDLLSCAGTIIAEYINPCKAAIISDSNVARLYGTIIERSFLSAGFDVVHYTFPAGEDSKNGHTYLSILNFLAENKLTRTDLIVALGGGVTGDLAGFAAATYLRGIPFVQIPTSLLAMVDSSVGGKTAIDLPSGKNLAGAFYQPQLVLCDIAALDTLPENVFIDGCAEVIKYGVLFDEVLFCHLEEKLLNFDRTYVITRCIELKRDVVALDEFDYGLRQKLNFGHTLGHSIEMLSSYKVSHGRAVSIGMSLITAASSNCDTCSQQTSLRLRHVLSSFGLPISTNYTAEEIFAAALSDKKRSGSSVNLIIPQSIGNCIIANKSLDEVYAIIQKGL